MARATRKVPISGGPHAGKTTLAEALKDVFTEAYFVPEPATEVITEEVALAKADPGYNPRVPWLGYSKFGPVVTEKSIELERLIPLGTELAFLDRSLIDTVAYARMNGCRSLIPNVWRRVRAAQYSLAFFCEPVGVYAATDVRRETDDEAVRTHEHLRQAYEESGIEVITLPAISLPERVELVRESLDV